MPETTYTFDELEPFSLAWHPAGYIWSPGPGGGQPVYRWPVETDDDGNATEPDLDDPRVNVMRADEFPWSGWHHFADCDCEACAGPSLCPACAALNEERDRWPLAVDPTGKTWERIPHDGDEPCGDCNAEQGEVHLDGCDIEVCPRCGGQMMICLTGGSRCQWPNLRYHYVNEKPGGDHAGGELVDRGGEWVDARFPIESDDRAQ